MEIDRVAYSDAELLGYGAWCVKRTMPLAAALMFMFFLAGFAAGRYLF